MPVTLTELVLILWFTTMSIYRVIGPALVSPVDLGWDAVVYTRAARALLDGGNPWAAGIPNGTFAAPPPSLIPFLPFAYLPDLPTQVVWVGLNVLAAAYLLRALRLKVWWLLFPPLVLAVAAGSSALPLVAVLVWGGVVARPAGGRVGRGDRAAVNAPDAGEPDPGRLALRGALADAAAVVGRVYSAIPLAVLGRWRGLALAAAAILVTAPFLRWDIYLRDFSSISATLEAQSGGGNSALAVPALAPVLVPMAIVGLVLVGRRKAAWLAVPALWPNAQEYYSVIALPIAASVPIATLAMATPLTPGIIAVGVLAQGLVDRWRARHRAGAGSARDGSAPEARAGTAAGARAPDHRATVDGQSSAHPSQAP